MFDNDSLFNDEAPAINEIKAITPDCALTQLRYRLGHRLYLGTSSWNFPGWRGIVWDSMSSVKGLSRDGLRAYSQYPLFRTVGVDRNFYQPMTRAEFAHYAELVPEDFRFLVKMPRMITDPVIRDSRGRPIGDNPDYLNVQKALIECIEPMIEGLAEKLGVAVFEFSALPRTMLHQTKQKHEVIDAYAKFFSLLKEQLPPHVCVASEMRTASILSPRYVNALRPSGVRPVIALHPTMPNIQRQVKMLQYWDAPDSEGSLWNVKGDIIVRWSLATDGSYQSLKNDWAPFDHIVRPDLVSRQAIVSLLVMAKSCGVRGFVVANNKAEGCAPLTMRALAEDLANRPMQ